MEGRANVLVGTFFGTRREKAFVLPSLASLGLSWAGGSLEWVGSAVCGGSIMDCVMLKGGSKEGVAMLDTEFGGLGLCDVDTGEVMDVTEGTS
ncbi:hypothetical protein E2C01_044316 [Portunus trituberculatus]|uniref:Uncharacterized protein n=1 Tax=Portunus trituberculatus TaxID=210409 RepID=A0A5B7FYI0_PORTR|nr:hypothetical protein [Portunus trituberculatus]